jgi:hypothetical protein
MATSTQGSKISYQVQTLGFNNPATDDMDDFRLEGEPDVETPTQEGDGPDNIDANPFENEKPITESQPSDTGMKLTTLIRQADVAGEDSALVTAFRAGGCSVVSGTNTTVEAGSTLGVITVADATGLEAGMGLNTELDDGSFFPALIAAVNTLAITLAMELPSATSEGKAVNKCFVITPNNMQSVPADQLLTLLHADKSGQTQNQDCALTAIGDLNFNPGEKKMIELTFGTSDKSLVDTPMTGTNDFKDGLAALRVHDPFCQFTNTPATWTAALTAAYQKTLSMSVALNLTCVQVGSFGDANCKNNMQGWMQVGEPPAITVEMLYDSTKLSDFDGLNTSKYMSCVMAGRSATDPSIGFYAPDAHQMEPPEKTYYGNAQHQVTVKYTSNPAGIAGTTSSDQGNQPWYLLIGDRSA